MPIIVDGPSSPGDNPAPEPLIAHVEVVAGDDFKAADGHALNWSSDLWPNLAGASLSMVVGHDQYNLYGNLPVTWTGTVPSSPANPTVITLDVTSAQTSVLARDEYDYTLTATLVDGDEITIATGKLTALASPGSLPQFPPAV